MSEEIGKLSLTLKVAIKGVDYLIHLNDYGPLCRSKLIASGTLLGNRSTRYENLKRLKEMGLVKIEKKPLVGAPPKINKMRNRIESATYRTEEDFRERDSSKRDVVMLTNKGHLLVRYLHKLLYELEKSKNDKELEIEDLQFINKRVKKLNKKETDIWIREYAFLEIKHRTIRSNFPFYKHDLLTECLHDVMENSRQKLREDAEKFILELYDQAIENRDFQWLEGKIRKRDNRNDEERFRSYWNMLMNPPNKAEEGKVFKKIAKLLDIYFLVKVIPREWLQKIMDEMIKDPIKEGFWLNLLKKNIHSEESRRYIKSVLLDYLEKNKDAEDRILLLLRDPIYLGLEYPEIEDGGYN